MRLAQIEGARSQSHAGGRRAGRRSGTSPFFAPVFALQKCRLPLVCIWYHGLISTMWSAPLGVHLLLGGERDRRRLALTRRCEICPPGSVSSLGIAVFRRRLPKLACASQVALGQPVWRSTSVTGPACEQCQEPRASPRAVRTNCAEVALQPMLELELRRVRERNT